jgi:hypothetical protein
MVDRAASGSSRRGDHGTTAANGAGIRDCQLKRFDQRLDPERLGKRGADVGAARAKERRAFFEGLLVAARTSRMGSLEPLSISLSISRSLSALGITRSSTYAAGCFANPASA